MERKGSLQERENEMGNNNEMKEGRRKGVEEDNGKDEKMGKGVKG